MAKRYVTTLMKRLNKVSSVEVSFEYGDHPEWAALRQEIVDALTFWKFYENIYDHKQGIKGLPDDTDDLRHELLEHVASEESLRGFIACWLRLPPTVVETLKWTANLDIQSRESFLRRVTAEQIQAVRNAYEEFFVHQSVPSCLRDGLFRTYVHREVTHESLSEEWLLSEKRTESKSAWAKEYAFMGFGHAKYPEGAGDDTTDSGTLRKFLSVKNHANDFAVNQHDGLYWFLYKTLRSNYIWNRKADVHLKPMICPGFWITILCWAFFALLSPILAITVLFPLLVGGVEASFGTIVAALFGAVSPILLLLYGIFYFFRDSKTIVWIDEALCNHFKKHSRSWKIGIKAGCFAGVNMLGILLTTFIANQQELPKLYLFIPLLWLGAYWVRAAKERDVFFDIYDREKAGIVALTLASFVMLLAPFTMLILTGIWEIASLLALAFVQALATFSIQILLLALMAGIAWIVHWRTKRLREYQTARTGVTKDSVVKEYKLFTTLLCVVGCFYIGIGLWFASSMVASGLSLIDLIYPTVVLAVIAGIALFVIRDAYVVRKTDVEILVKRNAYINMLREHGLYGSELLMNLMYNEWIVNHDNPLEAAKKTREFVTELMSYVYDSGRQEMLTSKAICIIDERTATQFASYTYRVNRDAYLELRRKHYDEYVLLALEGYTPEKALQKVQKLIAHHEGKKSFWQNSFPVRFLAKCGNGLQFIGSAFAKICGDLFGMWQIFHKYCPAVAETKQI